MCVCVCVALGVIFFINRTKIFSTFISTVVFFSPVNGIIKHIIFIILECLESFLLSFWSKVGKLRRGWLEGCLFNCFSIVFSKTASSTIFWVFGMTRPGIELRTPEPLASWLSVIWKSDLTDKMKRSLFQTAVVSILLYGCTTWMLRKSLTATTQECCEQ